MKANASKTRLMTKLWRVFRANFLLQFASDELYLKLLYQSRFGRKLDLESPQTFSEKLQWLKLRDRRPLYTRLVDKHEVKQWVSERIGESHIVPTLGVWNSFNEINFAELPEQFVLKSTHDSGGLAICQDRGSFDFASAERKIQRSLERNYFRSGREWPYKDVPPRVLAEVYFPTWVPEHLRDANGQDDSLNNVIDAQIQQHGVTDYKFYCFHGQPQFLYVSQGLHDHSTAQMIFLNLDWTPTGFRRSDYAHFREIPERPATFDRMVEIARELSLGVPFVRVDLFEHRGQVLFSEMTFHPVSGLMPIEPESADLAIGDMLDLSAIASHHD